MEDEALRITNYERELHILNYKSWITKKGGKMHNFRKQKAWNHQNALCLV